MPIVRRSATSRRPMARRRCLPAAGLAARDSRSSDVGDAGPAEAAGKSRAWTRPARIGVAAFVAVLAAVTVIGALSPSPVAGGAGASAAASGSGTSGAASVVGAAWGGAGGLDLIDLVTKGGLVLILLFITLRVLGRMQASAPRRGGNLSVLESRTLASKASLHLVAIGDRRLVVGLTPNGMVALAELDAAELEAVGADPSTLDESEGLTARARTAASARPTRAAASSAQLPFGATLNSLMAPIDGLTDRLSGFFNGGRVR
jgi:flagellar biogenesis protein FliO